MEFSSDVLSIEVTDHVATLWLDRPDARNAMGHALWNDLPRAAATIAGDPSIRVVIVAARGSAVSVGLDLKDMGAGLVGSGDAGTSEAVRNQRTYATIRTMQTSITSIAQLEMPVIAAVHGYCIGAGVDLISACDIRLSSSDATYSVRETRIAIVADMGTLQRLPRLIGAGHVAELAFTGNDIDAHRALQIGLVNSLHGDSGGDVYAAAQALARTIAANSPLAVRGTKAVLAANEGRSVDEGLEFVAQWNTMYLQTNDLREAITAFIERRPPVFRGD